ncbi:hypothetical protein TREMEDRAFT_65185 [Tremella mesenterica DSM 1558]|uniref:uncharacterized protein n=1 Tax=Tremella mesenterica (strain ATCC 24925 / CBS 8224 / DSM 1558 / NBRC 9311 / NRRL Y-6157 / RJB 2259-6 / UBC 559-6) TaxID=578456 RepID=UPI00032C3610|nr:uncharacterized protein TREMEDRAFT_65185 [Tremella mesenterica DSM 1558]EIW66783.1 hypothetical protein TREMEDRAFT_65185 [Tremella mesenterica DSM 1558]
MRLLLPLLCAVSLINAQSTTSSVSNGSNQSGSSDPTPTPTTKGNNTLEVITTTITQLISSGSASPTSTTFALTLTLNSTAPTLNSTLSGNGTLLGNATLDNATVPWNETDQWLPFHVVIDPAYGTFGAVMILTGIPVAGLGGKNRWSSLAIVSGYSLMLFTLVMILRFGVEPNLQPPSPSPPSTTLRGLYLLACLIASFFGAAIGIFFFNFAKYWISATGGFALGWFLLATRHGGLISSTLGRWGLLGGLTVAGFVGGLVPILHEHMILVSTALIGATAVTLGIDCYSRGGLKEFYIYNLGFHDLFPKLDNMRYPLTQTMMIELGVLAAIFIMGGAIQFPLLNILQRRLKQMREEEEARIEAEEVTKAAERFKNLGNEMSQWEEKHGHGTSNSVSTGISPRSPTPGTPGYENGTLPRLSFVDPGSGSGRSGRAESTLSLLRPSPASARTSTYEALALDSPTTSTPILQHNSQAPSISKFEGLEGLLSDSTSPVTPPNNKSTILIDEDLANKMRLLEEVKKAREEVKKAREEVHSSLERTRTVTPTPSLLSHLDPSREGARTPMTPLNMGLNPSSASSAEMGMNSGRRFSNASSMVLDRESSTPNTNMIQGYVPLNPGLGMDDRRGRTKSMHEISGLESGWNKDDREGRRSMADLTRPLSTDQSIRYGQHQGQKNEIGERRSTYHEPSSHNQHIVTGSAASILHPTQSKPRPQRSMTFEELAERHRKRLSSLQEPVTAKMREEVQAAEARMKWEAQKKREKAEMLRKEKEKERMGGSQGSASGGSASGRGKEKVERMEVLKNADEWRKSVGDGQVRRSVYQNPQVYSVQEQEQGARGNSGGAYGMGLGREGQGQGMGRGGKRRSGYEYPS